MEILLKRIAKKSDYTIGKLFIGEEYFCDTLEPTWRNLLGVELPPEMVSRHLGRNSGVKARKEPGKTAIPEGRYPLVMTKSMRFKKWLPLLLGVPGFSGVRIHAGNTAKDTQGCILVGENKERGKVINSTATFRKLYPILQAADERGESITIEVTR